MKEHLYIVIGKVFNEYQEILGIYDKIDLALIRQDEFNKSDYDDVIIRTLILNEDINPE